MGKGNAPDKIKALRDAGVVVVNALPKVGIALQQASHLYLYLISIIYIYLIGNVNCWIVIIKCIVYSFFGLSDLSSSDAAMMYPSATTFTMAAAAPAA